jgi:hypothetical protein
MVRLVKFFLSLSLLLIVCAQAIASNEPNRLVVKMTDGTENIFVLSEKPVVTFDSKKVYISSSSFSTELSNVQEFYFQAESSVPTDINEIKPDGSVDTSAKFVFRYVDGQTVSIEGSAAPDRVSVYALNGSLVSAQVDKSTNQVIVHLNSLPSGIYIIRANSQSFKISKR